MLADILTDFPTRFATMRRAYLQCTGKKEPTPVAIERAWLHKGRVVLKLTDIHSISDAELLRGAELLIPASERMALETDAIYIDDLIGCTLLNMEDERAVSIGVVRDIVRQEATADLLLVSDENGLEHTIPFAKAYLSRIDLPNRILEMTLPSGLLDVNAPITAEERQVQARNNNVDVVGDASNPRVAERR